MGKLVFGGLLLAVSFFMMIARAGLSGTSPRPAASLLRLVALALATVGGLVILGALIVVMEPGEVG
ncbi:MAG: hypothetical protein ACREMO_12955, partial [Gemmatimonadales bacterium]